MPFISCTTLFLMMVSIRWAFLIYFISSDILIKFFAKTSCCRFFFFSWVFTFRRSCSRPLSGRGQSGHFSENDRLTSLPPFSPFLVSVGVWDVDGNATPCFLPQSQAYTKKQPSQHVMSGGLQGLYLSVYSWWTRPNLFSTIFTCA